MSSTKNISNLFCILFITTLLLAFYSEGLNMYFITDDWAEFTFVEAIRDTFYVGSPDEGTRGIRPVRYALLDLMHSAFGLYPLPYHAVALFLHLINSILVFFIVKRITGDGIVGFLVSSLFATFWTHTEAIVCIPAMQDVMLATFCILCLVFFYYYRANPTWPRYVLTLSFFIMALGTKEYATLFLAPLLYLTDRYIVMESEGASIRTNLSVAAYIPFLLLTVFWMYLVMTNSGPASFVKTNASAAKTLDNFVRSVTFCFAFPLFSESPRFGIINLILLAISYFLLPIQIKSRVSLLMASLVIVCLPTSPLISPAPRYLYFSAIFSMAIFAIVFYHGALQLSRKISVTDTLCKFIIIFYVSLLVYCSYAFVNKQVKDYISFGRTSENILKTITASFPKGTRDVHIILINYPALGPEGTRYSGSMTLWGSMDLPLLEYYGKGNVGTISEFNLPELWDAKSRFYQLSEDSTISSAEFEKLTKEKNNKVYLFDPELENIHDVTGQDFLYAKELIKKS